MEETQQIAPLSPRFDGQIYVLTDANTFSAAGELTGLLKSYTNAIFVGEEAGGNPVQNVSSVTIPLRLPNTGVQVMMPFVLNRTAVNFENTGRGIIPDFPIKNTVKDKLVGKDSVLDFALEIAKKQLVNH